MSKLSQIEEWQEDILRRRASRVGDYADLISFLAVKQDLNEIYRIRCRLSPSRVRDCLYCDVFLQSEESSPPVDMRGQLVRSGEVWLQYVYAKSLLQRGFIAETLQLARDILAIEPHNTVVLNLVFKFLLFAGEKSLARLLLDSSLGSNPIQKDLEDLWQNETLLDTFSLGIYPKKFKVSFYIPVYNVEQHIAYALEAILSQNYPIHEVIVVNDGTSDRSREIAEKYPVKIIDHDENRGLAAARNTAFQAATGEVVATVDTDAYPTPDYLRNMLMEFENAHVQLGGVGGRFLELYREAPADLYRKRYLHQDAGPQRQCPASMLFGCNTIFKKSVVIELGGYNEKYRTNAEDADVSRRISAAGCLLVYTPYARVYHRRRDTPASILKTRWKYYYWFLQENGFYSSLTKTAHLFLEYVKVCALRFQENKTERCIGLLYLHVLMVVHHVCSDLLELVQERILKPSEARELQELLWQVLEHVDQKYKGDVGQNLKNNTQHLLVSAPASPLSNNPLFIQAYQLFLQRFASLFTEENYALLMESLQKIRAIYSVDY